MNIDSNLERLTILLSLAQRRANESKLDGQARLSTKSVRDTLGLVYSELSTLLEDPTIQPLVKEFNQDKITLNGENDIPEETVPDDEVSMDELPPEEEEPEPIEELPPIEEPTYETPPVEDEDEKLEPITHSGPSVVAKMARRALAKS